MDRNIINYGWGLVAAWLLCMLVIATSYHSTRTTKEQIYELGSSVQKLRDSFAFETPYRVMMANDQALDLQLIYALRLQIDAQYKKAWISPDINHLLFTTDRFIDQAKVYLENSLDLQNLVEQIKVMRERHADNQRVSFLYYILSANVLEALFGDNRSSPQIFRDIDNVYALSTALPQQEQQDLQEILASVSAVLGAYAKGQYIVDNIIAHDVHAQISAQNGQFNSLLAMHIWLAGTVSALVMATFMGLLIWGHRIRVLSDSESTSSESEEGTSQREVNVAVSHVEPRKKVKIPMGGEINFTQMMDSFDNDTESVRMLLEVFIEDHSDDIDVMRDLIAKGNAEEVHRKVHSLKGVGGNLGADNIKNLSGQIEEIVMDDLSSVAPLLEKLSVHLEQAITEARNFLDEAT